MGLFLHPNQPSRYSNTVWLTPPAALEHVVHPKFLSDPVDPLVRVLVSHRRSTRDHPQQVRRHLSEMRDDLLSQAVAEIFLPTVTAQILERKYHQHNARPFGASRCRPAFRCCYPRLEAVTFARDRLDVLGFLWI